MVSYATGVKVLDSPESGTHGDMTLISWAVTRPEEESRENWDAKVVDQHRKDLAEMLDCEWVDDISAKDLINGAPELIRVSAIMTTIDLNVEISQFGLYDRKELNTWHRGRVVLIGDAAHPTAPVRSRSLDFPLWYMLALFLRYPASWTRRKPIIGGCFHAD